MSEEPTNPEEETASVAASEAPAAKAPLRGGFLLKALPGMALMAWAAALGVSALVLNPPSFLSGAGFSLYGWAAPNVVYFMLVLSSLACVVVAMLRPGLLWPFAAAALLVPLGTGAKLLAARPHAGDWQGGDLLAAMVFAGCLLLLVEFISAVPRFNGIVRSSQGLAQDERTHVNRFIARYVTMSIVLGLAYIFAAFLLAGIVFPAIGSQISMRMAQGIELRTAIGITVFSVVLLSIPILVRLIIDGLGGRRRPDDEEVAA